MWTSLVFSLIGGLAACSSHKTDESTSPADDVAMATQPTGNELSTDLDQPNSSSKSKGGGAAGTTAHDTGFGHRHAPEVKDQPFHAGDQVMNAYYFVRNPNETWASLSQTIYDRADRADLLANWNHRGTLKVGRVIYYNSVLRPTDESSMKVFTEDFGYSLQQVAVRKGDSLSSIAKGLYGDAQSWKEIAALNPSISNPDIIQVGQKIAVQPAQIDVKTPISQFIAQNSISDAKSDKVVDNKETKPNETAQVAKTDQSGEGGVAAITKFAKANAPIIGGVIALAILAGVGVVVRKRIMEKKAYEAANATKNWDDPAGNVTKLTRPKTNV